ncbi:MAG: hypothetical protein GY756_06985 [bacterium]|nr:hypothetical protein [bacterium]
MNDKEMLNSILDNFQGILNFKDLDGKYTIVAKDTLEIIKNNPELTNEVSGKTDHEIGFKFADEYRKNDLKVIASKKSEIFQEKYDINGKVITREFIKFPVLNDNNEVIGTSIISTARY